MTQYTCSVCGYVYDEAKGIPEAGIAPGTAWDALPEGWVCPWCGASKDAFRAKQDEAAPAAAPTAPVELHADTELSAMELSIICSNLARGCEKQYLQAQSDSFRQLADFFRSAAAPAASASTQELIELVERDLSEGFPNGNAAAGVQPDRGALRCQVWSEKVTRMLQSLLTRYAQEGEAMLEHTGVYVCTICGFVYVGDRAPELCPVCKVPSWKFEKIEGRAL